MLTVREEALRNGKSLLKKIPRLLLEEAVECRATEGGENLNVFLSLFKGNVTPTEMLRLNGLHPPQTKNDFSLCVG